jgi:hypothetical protein
VDVEHGLELAPSATSAGAMKKDLPKKPGRCVAWLVAPFAAEVPAAPLSSAPSSTSSAKGMPSSSDAIFQFYS